LTEEQIENLVQYKHSSPKTTVELWMIDWVSGPFEKYCIPDIFTPNIVSILGNMALPIVMWMIITQVGTTLTNKDPTRDDLIILGGCALQWFSQFDIMDGQRARRQKSGSPLGRIIDEANDMI
jgi:phosphatidylglycerophosphate synthase